MNIEVKKAKILIYLVLLSYLKPANVTLIVGLDTIYKIMKVASTILLLVTISKYPIRISRTLFLGLMFLIVWEVSIILNTGSVVAYAQEILSIIGVLLLCDLLKKFSGGVRLLLDALYNISQSYIFLNFVTVLLDRPLFARPEVCYIKYFLGSDNYSAFILIVLCGFLFASDLYRVNKIRLYSWIIAFMGLLSLIIPFAVTGMISYGLFLCFVALIDYPQLRKLFSIRNVVIISTAFLFAVVIFNIQDYLGGFLAVIGKVGLNSREIIWPFTVTAFMQRPWIGYGTLTQAQIDSFILYGANHAHNIILEFLLDTGIVGTMIISYMGYNIIKNTMKIKKKHICCFRICLAAYIVCSVFDFYIGLIYFWLLLAVMDFCKTAIERNKKSFLNEE